MPLIQRYTKVTRGALILTGNAMNCRQSTAYPPAPVDYRNGSYISTNTSLVADPGFPAGTTKLYTSSSSTGYVDIPSGSTVLFAQLFWVINSVSYPTPNASIIFDTPITSTTIAPNLSLTQLFSSYVVFQAQDVKNLVAQGGTGFYTVRNIPGIATVNASTQVGNGWGLIIVYANKSMPTRYFNINTGLAAASSSAPSDFNFTGFVTPTTGSIKGYLVASETNGDLLDAAQILVGPTLASATQVGNTSNPWDGLPPYSPIDNMLPGNILIADCNDPDIGLLDTRGTFGNFNKDPFANTAPAFARLNMDIAGWNISNNLINNQKSLFTRITYGGSGTGQVTSQSVQVDTNAADLSNISKSVDLNYANTGATIKYTVSFRNTGVVNATNVILVDTLPIGTTLIPNTLYINGVLTNTTPQHPGISFGTIPVNSGATITFQVIVSSTMPSPNPLLNNAEVRYDYTLDPSIPKINAIDYSNTVVTTIIDVKLTSSKLVDQNFTQIGEILTYTIVMNNLSSDNLSNVFLIDTVPVGTIFVPNTLQQDGTLVTVNSPIYVSLPNSINPLSVSTVQFQLQVVSIPSPNVVVNNAVTKAQYASITLPGTFDDVFAMTNDVTTTISAANFINISKYVDSNYTTVGKDVVYTIVITNVGKFTANNLLLIDTISSSVAFVNNSVFIDGIQSIGADPNAGFSIPDILPGHISTVTFKVHVN